MPENLDISRFEHTVFTRGNVLGRLLSFCRRLLGARHAGIMYGTDHTGEKFVPPGNWDRAVMHKFEGNGAAGLALKLFGPAWVSLIGLSPIRIYSTDPFGEKRENDGVIAHVVRKQQDYYDQGIKVLLIDRIAMDVVIADPGSYLAVTSYDGDCFEPLTDIRVNLDIIKRFKPDNFLAAFIPDYGAIIFNTIHPELLEKNDTGYLRQDLLKQKLNLLIAAIETASLAYLGKAKGRAAVQMIWRKERNLRRAFATVKSQAEALEEQKKYLQAVGGVTADKLNMAPINVSDGVYAFMDMKGSAKIRNKLTPRDFFLVLTLCHEIAADTAAAFGCRVDNFLGDGMFLENVSVFDLPGRISPSGYPERLMIMATTLGSILAQINRLKQGTHPMDPDQKVAGILKRQDLSLDFRAGMAWGQALIGPLGSSRRRIITAIGEAVNIASRLESTGTANCIHVTRNVLDRLNHSTVEPNSCLAAAVAENRDLGALPVLADDMPFFSFFSALLGVKGTFVREQHQVAYKEFSQDTTYLIRCIPKAPVARGPDCVCAGI